MNIAIRTSTSPETHLTQGDSTLEAGQQHRHGRRRRHSRGQPGCLPTPPYWTCNQIMMQSRIEPATLHEGAESVADCNHDAIVCKAYSAAYPSPTCYIACAPPADRAHASCGLVSTRVGLLHPNMPRYFRCDCVRAHLPAAR